MFASKLSFTPEEKHLCIPFEVILLCRQSHVQVQFATKRKNWYNLVTDRDVANMLDDNMSIELIKVLQ